MFVRACSRSPKHSHLCFYTYSTHLYISFGWNILHISTRTFVLEPFPGWFIRAWLNKVNWRWDLTGFPRAILSLIVIIIPSSSFSFPILVIPIWHSKSQSKEEIVDAWTPVQIFLKIRSGSPRGFRNLPLNMQMRSRFIGVLVSALKQKICGIEFRFAGV